MKKDIIPNLVKGLKEDGKDKEVDKFIKDIRAILSKKRQDFEQLELLQETKQPSQIAVNELAKMRKSLSKNKL